jgi:uncharacterized protein (DUF927 family)
MGGNEMGGARDNSLHTTITFVVTQISAQQHKRKEGGVAVLTLENTHIPCKENVFKLQFLSNLLSSLSVTDGEIS